MRTGAAGERHMALRVNGMRANVEELYRLNFPAKSWYVALEPSAASLTAETHLQP
jgi:hypothetical protein